MAEVRAGGVMASGVAALFIRGGWDAHVRTRVGEHARALPARVKAALAGMPAFGTPGDLVVHATPDALPWPEIDLVVACASEDPALKQALFAELERLARPDVPLATNTSSLPIGSIAGELATR